jgi:hypothetical protein
MIDFFVKVPVYQQYIAPCHNSLHVQLPAETKQFRYGMPRR